MPQNQMDSIRSVFWAIVAFILFLWNHLELSTRHLPKQYKEVDRPVWQCIRTCSKEQCQDTPFSISSHVRSLLLSFLSTPVSYNYKRLRSMVRWSLRFGVLSAIKEWMNIITINIRHRKTFFFNGFYSLIICFSIDVRFLDIFSTYLKSPTVR